MTLPTGTRYRVALRQAHDITWPQRRKWSTTFHVLAPSAQDAAMAVRGMWLAHLRGITSNSVFAYEVYSTSAQAADDDYVVLALAPGEQRGTYNNAAQGEFYLSKAVVAVTLSVAGSRPSRKFWRFGLREGDVQAGVAVVPALAGYISAAFAEVVNAFGDVLVDPDSQPIVGVGRLRLTTREFGRTAGADVPEPPPVG